MRRPRQINTPTAVSNMIGMQFPHRGDFGGKTRVQYPPSCAPVYRCLKARWHCNPLNQLSVHGIETIRKRNKLARHKESGL